MLYENKCVFCDFLQKMAFFANYKKTRNFQKVHPSFYCSPWSPLSKKPGWTCPQEMHTKCQLVLGFCWENADILWSQILYSDISIFSFCHKTGRYIQNIDKIFQGSIYDHIKIPYTKFQVSVSFGSVNRLFQN